MVGFGERLDPPERALCNGQRRGQEPLPGGLCRGRTVGRVSHLPLFSVSHLCWRPGRPGSALCYEMALYSARFVTDMRHGSGMGDLREAVI